MRIKINFKLISSLLLVLIFTFSFALKVNAIQLNNHYPTFGGLNINSSEGQDINQIIAWLYYFIVGISGFSAFFMFVWGGFEWSSSAGDPTKIGEAKNRIKSAAIGVLIVLSAYLVLQTINPELTTLTLP